MIARRHLTLVRNLWLSAYVMALFSPLVLLATAPPRGAEREVLFGIALGFIALTGVVLQLVIPSRIPTFTEPFGIGALLRLHRSMGFVVLALVTLHVAVFIHHEPDFAKWLFPIHEPPKAIAGFVAALALVLLVTTSLIRRLLRLSYEQWRVLHIVMGIILVIGAAVHVLLISWYSAIGSLHWFTVVVMAIGIIAMIYLRILRPFTTLDSPYVIADVRAERGNAVTVELAADGHPGVPFRAGQFAWLKLHGSAYSLTEHPFSFASSSLRPDRPSFTIRGAGDFTSGTSQLEPGTRVLLDGPHGAYEPVLPDAGFVFIVAGIGVTPAMSFLRSFVDSGDQRPIRMMYGARCLEEITFLEELEAISYQCELELVYVLSQPDASWTGLRGRLDAAAIRANLPADAMHRNHLVCGPPAMIRMTVRTLRHLGIPDEFVYADRFDSV